MSNSYNESSSPETLPDIEDEDDWETANIILNIPVIKKNQRNKIPPTPEIPERMTIGRQRAEESRILSYENGVKENVKLNYYSSTMKKMTKNNRSDFINLLNQDKNDNILRQFLRDRGLKYIPNRD